MINKNGKRPGPVSLTKTARPPVNSARTTKPMPFGMARYTSCACTGGDTSRRK